MKRTITYQVTLSDSEKTIEKFLKDKDITHQVLVNLKKTHNGILKNGIWAYTNEKLDLDDIVTINIIEDENSANILPVKIDFSIVYEDDDIIVIDKPAGMPVHPSMGNHDNTLANALMYYYNSQGKSFVFRCINRLDRDTTGLTIVAKHTLSSGILSNAVANRQIHRTYIAVCSGKTKDSGIIEAPIARQSDSTIERCVDFENGAYAVTTYKTLSYNSDKNISLVQLKLLTGRTHQIRVHMKHIGHPLIGDFLYNPDYRYMNRQSLHSYSLEFEHPITRKKMNFISDLPSDMKLLF